MFSFIFSLGSLFLVILIVTGTLNWLHKKNENFEKGIVKLPKLFQIIGIVCATFFLIIAIILILTSSTIIAPCVFLGFAFLSSCLIVGRLNCVIKYDENGFTHKNFWGIRRKYAYEDVTGISGNRKDVKLFAGKRIIRIDEYAVGGNQFTRTVQKKYRIAHDGKPIPNVKWGRTDIFNGHVENPGEFIFVYFMMLAITIGGVIFIYVSGRPLSYDDINYKETTFAHYKIEDDDIRLQTQYDKVFFIITQYKDYTQNLEALKNNCDDKTVFDVYYQKREPKNEASYYDIISLGDQNGNIYLTLAQTNAQIRKTTLQCETIFGVLLLFTLFFVIGSVIVGRHPEKYSKKFIRIFFQDGYVHADGTTPSVHVHKLKKKKK